MNTLLIEKLIRSNLIEILGVRCSYTVHGPMMFQNCWAARIIRSEDSTEYASPEVLKHWTHLPPIPKMGIYNLLRLAESLYAVDSK